MNVADLRAKIRDIKDFPTEGVLFKDITTLLRDGPAWRFAVDSLASHYNGDRVDIVVGVESRGFIFGAALAARTMASFVPVRKPGKLPAATDRVSYALEYGSDSLEMHKGSIHPDAKVLVVDDVIATGGTAAAAVELTRRQGGHVVGLAFAIELAFLNGRQKLPRDIDVYSVLTY